MKKNLNRPTQSEDEKINQKIADKTRHYPERLQYGRYEFYNAPPDLTRLTITYSFEQTQKILEEAEKGNFLVFVKVIWFDNTESYVSLTPTEITAIRNHHPNETNVVYGGPKPFFANIFHLWVVKTQADKLLTTTSAADTKLKQIVDEVTNKFWRNLGNKKTPKTIEIETWLIETYGISSNEAKAIDKICRPEFAKGGGTKPLK